MSKRCIIKKYLKKADEAYLSDVEVNKNDLGMICKLALVALDKNETINVVDEWKCPACGSDFMPSNYGDSYCRSCGKRLNWQEV